jgi:phospholipase C
MPLDTIGITADERLALPIDHVVVVMKENRSFDEYFGRLSRRRPDVEPLPLSFSNVDADGNVVTPFHETTTCSTMDPDHSWAGLHAAVNGGKMDGFVKVSGAAAMGWYDETDFPFYDFLVDHYALADRYFPSVLGPTFPNRHYLLLGTSTGIDCTGCAYPPVGTPSLLDELDVKGIAWGAYSEDGDPFEGVLGLEWRALHAPHVHAVEEFFAALRTGEVPSVSFVDSRQEIRDEHPRSDIQVGEAWTRELYEAIVASPIWRSTALFWVYDEGGGFADHVPPPTSCVAAPSEAAFFELGVRVPMVVASPWARRRYVSHLVHEHTSITRFVETLFDLPALTARDANSDALLDMFDFVCPPELAPPPAPPAGTGGCR